LAGLSILYLVFELQLMNLNREFSDIKILEK